MEPKNQKVFLLADDDSDDTEMFCEALMSTSKDVACHTAGNGREVLSLLERLAERPQLIFLDINMPIMSGWQCLQALKADTEYAAIPVIIISTSSHQREIEIARELGALCYYTKPSDFDELKHVLAVVVNNVNTDLPAALLHLQQRGVRIIYFPRLSGPNA